MGSLVFPRFPACDAGESPGISPQLLNGCQLGPKRCWSESKAACCWRLCHRPLAASPEARANMMTKNDIMIVIMSAKETIHSGRRRVFLPVWRPWG